MRIFLRSLVKLAAIVIVAGGIGVAIGIGLAELGGGDDSTTTVVSAATTAASDPPPAATSTQAATTTVPSVTTTTTPPSAAADRFAQVRVSVLDTRLFTDSTPSGRDKQRSRVTVRVRAENRGDERVTLETPTVRVGSVRIPVDPDGEQFTPLEPGTDMTVTLRFALAGEATPKVVRDRRARILIAGQSVAMRVRVRT